jgi:hypothetical protein
MSILSEGFDADDMKTVFIRPSSRLPAVQMGGRVLRKNDDHPVKQIVQCQDTRHPFVKTARAKSAWVQVGGEFRSLTKNENIEATARHYARQVVHADSALPAFMLARKSKRRSRSV